MFPARDEVQRIAFALDILPERIDKVLFLLLLPPLSSSPLSSSLNDCGNSGSRIIASVTKGERARRERGNTVRANTRMKTMRTLTTTRRRMRRRILMTTTTAMTTMMRRRRKRGRMVRRKRRRMKRRRCWWWWWEKRRVRRKRSKRGKGEGKGGCGGKSVLKHQAGERKQVTSDVISERI